MTHRLTLIMSALAHAPTDPGPIAPGLSGWDFGSFQVCSTCAGRLCARGCNTLLAGSSAVWATPIACDACKPATTSQRLARAARGSTRWSEAYALETLGRMLDDGTIYTGALT